MPKDNKIYRNPDYDHPICDKRGLSSLESFTRSKLHPRGFGKINFGYRSDDRHRRYCGPIGNNPIFYIEDND